MNGIEIDFNAPLVSQMSLVAQRIIELRANKNAYGLREIADLIVAAQKEAFEQWEGKALWDNCKDLVDCARSDAKTIEVEAEGEPKTPAKRLPPFEQPYIAVERASLIVVLENAACLLLDSGKDTTDAYKDVERLINHIKGQ